MPVLQQKEPPQEKPLPALRANLNFYPSARTSTGAPTWVIYDPIRHSYFNIGRLEFEMLSRWATAQSMEVLIAQINQKTSLYLSTETLGALIKFLSINQLLKPQGSEAIKQLLTLEAQSHKSIAAWLLHHYLFFRIPLVSPDRFLNRTLPLVRFFFTPTFAMILGICAIFGIYMISRQISVFFSTFSYFFSIEGLLIFAGALMFAKVIHELGHAYTAKRYGLRISTMGVAFLVMWPVLYTDTSDAWKLTSHRQRMWIDAAGVIVELELAIFATVLWNFLPDGPFRSAMFMLAVTTWAMTLLVNMNIFMRFDGYYLLSDYLGVNNLQDRSFALGRWWLREKIFCFGDPLPERFSPRQQRFMIFYAYGTWLYRLILFLGIALIVYFFFFKILGIFLMMVEIIWFIIRPIYREFSYWLTRRSDMHLNRNTLFSLILLLLGIALIVIPWKNTFKAPAIYRTQVHQSIYAPKAARILEIKIHSGQIVATGETLFVLEDPDIQYHLKAAQQREKLLKLQLSLQPTARIYLEQSHVLQQQLLEIQAEIQGYKAQEEQLHIKAPFSGEIVSVADSLRKGRWINSDLILARLVNKQNTQIIAYVNEKYLYNISLGTKGRFYPDAPDELSKDVKIITIDSANIVQLQASDYYVASIYEGQMPVRESVNNHLVPQEASYRVYLSTSQQTEIPQRVYPGTVVLEVNEKKSLIQVAWTLINTVLIRESGF